MQSKPFTWSWSALESFETCPKKHYHLRIAKDVVEPEGPALAWGRQAHTALENRVMKGTPLPAQFAMWEGYGAYISGLREQGAQVKAEVKHCLTSELAPTTYFGKDAWVRGASDVEVTRGRAMWVFDWKTGKLKPESGQLRLHTALVMQANPGIQKVSTAFVFLPDNAIVSEQFTRADLPKLWGEFLPRVKAMEQAVVSQTFQPRPSGLCKRHCPVVSCPHHGRGSY